MIYVLAFFLPFVCMFVKGLWIQAFFNLIVWLCGFVTFGAGTGFAIIWAWVSIAQKINKERHSQMLDTVAAGSIGVQRSFSEMKKEHFTQSNDSEN